MLYIVTKCSYVCPVIILRIKYVCLSSILLFFYTCLPSILLFFYLNPLFYFNYRNISSILKTYIIPRIINIYFIQTPLSQFLFIHLNCYWTIYKYKFNFYTLFNQNTFFKHKNNNDLNIYICSKIY